jgi:hypothetical protein
MIALAGLERGADRQAETAPRGNSRRLWSLWDMLAFNAAPFTAAIGSISQLQMLTQTISNHPSAFPMDGRLSLTASETRKLWGGCPR